MKFQRYKAGIELYPSLQKYVERYKDDRVIENNNNNNNNIKFIEFDSSGKIIYSINCVKVCNEFVPINKIISTDTYMFFYKIDDINCIFLSAQVYKELVLKIQLMQLHNEILPNCIIAHFSPEYINKYINYLDNNFYQYIQKFFTFIKPFQLLDDLKDN